MPAVGKLPFDQDVPDKAKAKSYDKLLDLANQPLSILNHIQTGDLTAEKLNHFKSMYPELHNQLSKKMTERITKMQMNGEQLPYHKRQMMSMFLGAPLDSSMTPQSAQSAQAVFAQQKAQSQMAPPSKAKKGTSTLNKVSEAYETGDQGRQARQQKG